MQFSQQFSDIGSIYKQTIKTIDFEDVTKELLDDRIHKFINDKKIINKRNRNADSYYVNMKLVDTGALELDFPSQELSKSVPTILIPDSLNDSPFLSESETPVMPKPNNSIKSPNHSKTQIPDKIAPKEVLENLRVEMIALKSFVVDQIYIMQKKSKYCETSAHCDDSQILVKSLNDQIDFVKSEINSKNAIIKMILDDHKNEVGQPKPFCNRIHSSTGNTNGNHKYQFQSLKKSSKIKKADPNKDFSSSNRFEILQENIKEIDHDLNENDPIDNNSDSSKDKEKTIWNRNTKTKAPTTVILGDSILRNVYGNTISKATKFKKHVIVKHFSGAKVDDMKHCMKSTQEKSPAQIIFHIGTNDLVTNKDSNEIANEIVQLAKSTKTDKSKVAISSLVPRKDKLNAKAKEVTTFLKEKSEKSNFDLISHFKINPHCHTNAKGPHLNNYGDRQLTKIFLNYIEKG